MTNKNKKIRISAVQMDCSLGQIKANADKMLAMAKRALEQEGAELVVFPELSLTGYDNRQGFDHLTRLSKNGFARRLSFPQIVK